jgi:hypothetical protein
VTVRALLSLAVLALLSGPSRVAAQAYPARSGELGILDVPDAEVLGVGASAMGAELRFDHSPGLDQSGPLPIYATAGLTSRLDLGFTVREGGQPGDPFPSRVYFGAAAKLQLWRSPGLVPSLALSLTGDRLNERGVVSGRLTLSSSPGRLRLAAFAGVEAQVDGLGGSGLTTGAAASVRIAPRFDLIAEALTGPRGANLGGAIRWLATPTIALSLGANHLPDDDATRVSLAVVFTPAPRSKAARPAEPQAVPAAPVEDTSALASLEDRPHFRLKIRTMEPSLLGEPRHLQAAPYRPPSAVAAAPPRLAAPPRAGGPATGDALEAQLKDQELQVAAQLRKLRSSDDELGRREAAAQAEARRLAERAEQLAARELQLDTREKRVQLRGAPTQQQRALESQEAQLAATERQLAATERGYLPTLDAAIGSERDAAAREQAERSERERLAALVGLEKVKAKQLDLRRQGVAATQRLLAGMEARLVAKGERLDTVERQLRTRGERLDAWQRRLEARTARLDGMEKRALDQQRGLEGERPATPVPVTAPDKAVFVVVVKSPTAIMKEPSARDAGAGARLDAVHPGVAVEKAVAAATVVTFTSPSSRLSELDRESIDSIARLAAREGCELLIWARAKEPGLMSEAIRRSEEIRGYVINTASLSPKQVVTRITTRPGAQGVDVVVSALRESGRSAQPAPAPVPAPEGTTAPGRLAGGETTRRQIRDAVLAVQPSIERCVGEQMLRRGLSRAEGTLQLSVSAQGRITGTDTGSGPLAGPELDECLGAASTGWAFPPADSAYLVDVPITVVRGGATR